MDNAMAEQFLMLLTQWTRDQAESVILAPELQRSTSKLWITTDFRHRLASPHKYLVTDLYRFYALLYRNLTLWLIASYFCV